MQKTRQSLWRYGRIFAANVCIAFAYAFFTVPNGVLTGGVASFCMSLSRLIPVSTTTLVNITTVMLALICLLFLGFDTLKGSLFFSLCYLSLYNLFSHVAAAHPITLSPFLYVPLAAVITGIGLFLCLESDATTIGVDTVALILHKKYPVLSVSPTIFVLSLAIQLFGLYTYGFLSLLMGMVFIGLRALTLSALIRLKAHQALNSSDKNTVTQK